MPASECQRTSIPAGATLDAWLQGLREQDLPVLGGTVQSLCNTAGARGSSATDLARVVLRDAGLTSDVIRTANSAYFNPSAQHISTVSRAVVLLGFNTVRSIGLSLAVIDSLVRGHHRDRVHRLFRESVEAALCARTMAEATGDRAAEEVFIAGLLYRIGELAFWCMAHDDAAAALEAALAENPATPREAERRVLGFSLRDLSRRLVKDWRLGDLTAEALKPGAPAGVRARTTRHAHDIVELLWRKDTDAAVAMIRDTTGLDDTGAQAVLERTRRELPALGRALGLDLEQSGAATEESEPEPERREPDPRLQLRVLREMTATVRESRDLQALFDLVMEGLYRGLALERCAIATLKRGQAGLRLRAALPDPDALTGCLDTLVPDDQALRLLIPERPMHLAADARRRMPPALDAILLDQVLVAPIRAAGRALGVLIAEQSGNTPDDETLQGFIHFAEQTEFCVSHLLQRSNQP
jgi:HD-like signal output (HDOD) protein